MAVMFLCTRVDGLALTYKVTDLGTLGGKASWADGVNDMGQVAGTSWISGNAAVHAFLWDPVNGMQDLGTLGSGPHSKAYDVNNAGQVVGTAWVNSYTWHAFLYSGGVMTDLGTGDGGSYSWSYGINDNGIVAGGTTFSGWGGYTAAIHTGAGWQNLGGFGGTTMGGSEASDINDTGQVVGWSFIPGVYISHAFLWTNGVMQDIGAGDHSSAAGINNLGEVVGNGGNGRGFLYSGGVLVDIGGAGPAAINDSGRIVGLKYRMMYPESEAALYSGGGVWTSLNSLKPLDAAGWDLLGVSDINNLGQMVGWGYHDGVQRAYLMSPDNDDDGYDVGEDCDDFNPDVHPGAAEVCDGVDNNCDGSIDEGVTTTYYHDTDLDTYGNPQDTIDACTLPPDYVIDNTDCNDVDPAINPGAVEICNDAKDNNCNGLIDVADPVCMNVSVTLAPDSTTIPRQSSLGYTVTGTNNTSIVQTIQYWTYVILPNGTRYPATGELYGPVTVTLNPGQTRNAHLTNWIPGGAPLGTYTYYGQVGPYPTVWNQDQFDFTVTTSTTIQEKPEQKWQLPENGFGE